MKTKAQHVPGPWGVEDEGHLEHEGNIWIVAGRGGLCVAEIEVCNDAVIGPEMAGANAQLIAAAPEGFALALKAREVCALFGTDDPRGLEDLKQAVHELRAAERAYFATVEDR